MLQKPELEAGARRAVGQGLDRDARGGKRRLQLRVCGPAQTSGHQEVSWMRWRTSPLQPSGESAVLWAVSDAGPRRPCHTRRPAGIVRGGSQRCH